jgi:hypothetical protein
MGSEVEMRTTLPSMEPGTLGGAPCGAQKGKEALLQSVLS